MRCQRQNQALILETQMHCQGIDMANENKWGIKTTTFTTLEMRKNLRRVSSRNTLWGHSWGQYSFLSFVLSLVTVPQTTAR